MEFLTEFLIEFLLEGSIELGTNKKVPVFIRYPLLFLILISILLVLGGIFLLALMIRKENIWIFLFLIGMDLFLILGFLLKVYHVHQKKK
jgi:hypothetical protein